MNKNRTNFINMAIVGLVTLLAAENSFGYVIEMSKYGLVDPGKAYTGQHTTSPFDAEYNASTKKTDVWLTDMNGSYDGRRVFNWTLDESSGSDVWSYNGAFTTHNTSGIRALNVKDSGSLLIAHENGEIATYDRNTGAAGHLDLGSKTDSFSIGGLDPHHMAFDGSLIWTNQGYDGAFGASGSIINAYNLTGVNVASFTTLSTYTEGIAAAGGSIYIYNAGASVYGYPDDGYVGDILKYSTVGILEDVFSYESGDRPPFHSEALSYDGKHFWMAGYTDGKVYRMAAEGDEKNFGLVPEPTTIALMTFGLAGIGFRKKKQA